jgi:hypothetical protein
VKLKSRVKTVFAVNILAEMDVLALFHVKQGAGMKRDPAE